MSPRAVIGPQAGVWTKCFKVEEESVLRSVFKTSDSEAPVVNKDTLIKIPVLLYHHVRTLVCFVGSVWSALWS